MDNAIFGENFPLNLKNLPRPPFLLSSSLTWSLDFSASEHDRGSNSIPRDQGGAPEAWLRETSPGSAMTAFRVNDSSARAIWKKMRKKGRRNFPETEDVTIWARHFGDLSLSDCRVSNLAAIGTGQASTRERERNKIDEYLHFSFHLHFHNVFSLLEPKRTYIKKSACAKSKTKG